MSPYRSTPWPAGTPSWADVTTPRTAPGFDTPYGRMAAVVDPFGAAFWVMTPAWPAS